MKGLSQEQADELIAMHKYYRSAATVPFPMKGDKLKVTLTSDDPDTEFILDISRHLIKIEKVKFQTRVYEAFKLVRLDLGGAPHRNPDGREVECPHIHIYTEGYGDRFAFPLTDPQYRDFFPEPSNHTRTLHDFMRFCRVVEPPQFDFNLFS